MEWTLRQTKASPHERNHSGRLHRVRALQWTLAPLAAAGAAGFVARIPWLADYLLILQIGLPLSFLLGGWLLPTRPELARGLLTLGTVFYCGLTGIAHLENPTGAYVLLTLGIINLAYAWGAAGACPLHAWRANLDASSFTSALALLAAWLVLAIFDLLNQEAFGIALGAAALITLGYTLCWVLLDRRLSQSVRYQVGGASGVASGVVLWTALTYPDLFPAALLLIPLVTLLSFLVTRHSGAETNFLGPLVLRPEAAILVTFLALSAVGTILLTLPHSSADGRPIALLDGAFTAVSAVCVTGLIVLDTPNDFSAFGQTLIALLIQMGGLGIMSYSAIAAFLFGRRLSVRQEGFLFNASAYRDRAEIKSLLRDVITVTFVAESVGAMVLFVAFLSEGEPWNTAMGRAIFTSISAFCNAGFTLQTDNMTGYQHNAIILHTVAALVVIGGLSPGFVLAVPRVWKGHQASLQFRAVVVVNIILLLAGTLTFAAFEWSHGLTGLSPLERINSAWFHSTASRTAGFNAVDMAQLRPATLVVMMLLMFVGGSPGGTAGGIKTTTFFVLMVAVLDAFRGGGARVNAFGRRIPHEIVYKSAAVATAGIIAGFTMLVAIMLTQDMEPLTAMFEVVSALGTVGLSIGGTALLDEVGKLIIMFCMLAGRIGPITVFLVLARPDERADPWALPEEELVVT